MSVDDNIFLKVHRIDSNGIFNSIQLEIDCTDQIVSNTVINDTEIDKEKIKWGYLEEDKLHLKYSPYVEEKSPTITLIKIGGFDELNPMNYATQINSSINEDPEDTKYIFTVTNKQQNRHVNLPDTTMISCQNCDTAFPTKYQYQRHQCEFNAEKVVLKPEIIGKDIDKATRMRFECEICQKTFVSNNNLERHRSCHASNRTNVCEFCKKSFVSENRLKIHKENHCKKAGDMTKFYRSDVVVWHCGKCKQVFATQQGGLKHIEICTIIVNETKVENNVNITINKNGEISEVSKEDGLTGLKSVFNENDFDTNFELAIKTQNDDVGLYKESNELSKVVTEILYQCEFCNQTYITKGTLLEHQKTHTTEKNYECVFCEKEFTNFTQAAIHWQNKCTEESNLFYLPKMIYCEHCDRGFKSHEILYSHKNKKKHFTPKIHDRKLAEDNDLKNENAIVKLIENMITKMEKNGFPKNIENTDKILGEQNGESEETDVNIKTEDKEEGVDENGKRKRGRKRKWHKTDIRNKKKDGPIEGYMYQCERCGAVVDTIPGLDSHKESAHISTFTCQQCGQIVHSAKALMIHCRAHQSLKPYVCNQCGRSYSQTSHLWQHMRFHQGIKPFACPHEGCEARYTIRPDLKDHIRKVHTRERPFKCSVCQKCFLTGSVYYQHRLIHTNDRRYGCEVCNKRFFRADALNNHRRIHTDERPYPCPVCGREFRQKGDRNKHVRTQHPI